MYTVLTHSKEPAIPEDIQSTKAEDLDERVHAQHLWLAKH